MGNRVDETINYERTNSNGFEETGNCLTKKEIIRGQIQAGNKRDEKGSYKSTNSNGFKETGNCLMKQEIMRGQIQTGNRLDETGNYEDKFKRATLGNRPGETGNYERTNSKCLQPVCFWNDRYQYIFLFLLRETEYQWGCLECCDNSPLPCLLLFKP